VLSGDGPKPFSGATGATSRKTIEKQGLLSAFAILGAAAIAAAAKLKK
jgi:hypothetical protein